MSENSYFRFSNSILVVPLLAVLSIWTVYWVEVRFHINLNQYGIYPRTLTGLRGVLFGPFLHSSVGHLYNNTIPLALLLAALVYFYPRIWLRVLCLGILLSGIFTWIIGRPSYHIGASGVIYVLASFIFFKGVFTKYFRLVAVSLIVVFIYGGMLWFIFPIQEDISWEGHLSGFFTGLLLAIFLKAQIPSQHRFKWETEDYKEEDDEFLRYFDEDGNFIENKEETQGEEDSIKVTYHFKKDSAADGQEADS